MQPHMLERGLTYRGSGEALRRFVAKLESGQRVVVSALGGSVTRGHGGGPDSMNAEKGFPGSWSRHVFDFIQVRERRDGRATLRVRSPPLQARWPAQKHVYYNGAVPATGAYYFVNCLSRCAPFGTRPAALAH
jgi:hypothetical protein